MTTVLHVIDTAGPGGAETVFLEICTGLEQHRYRSICVVGQDGWLADRLRRRGLKTVILPSSGSLNVGYLRQLMRLIRTERPDLITAHLYGPAVYCGLAGLLSLRPVVSILHGQSDISQSGRFDTLKRLLMRWGSRRVVFVSDKLKQDLQPALKIPNSICSVIQNGVDIDRFARPSARALRTELGLRPDSILVGAIGNIRHAKAYDVFLRAAKILKTLSPRYRFAIAGEGSGALYEELLRLRAELGLGSDLAFLGLRSDIPQIVQSLDIFALSSITEGFSLACVEAMAARIPVVATRCGGPEEIIVDESSGLLVQPRSPEALAKAIHRIAFDQELSVRLAANALNRVRERYAVGAMVGAYDQLFRQLLESAPGAGSLQR